MDLSTSISWTLSPAVTAEARQAGSAAFVFAVVTATAAAQGGYFPPSWGWSALGCLLVAFSLLLLGADVRLSRLEGAFLVSLLLLLVWTASSAAWSLSAGRAVQEAERTAVYVSAVLALLIVARGAASAVAVGVAGAATAVSAYALATRLLPDMLGYDGDGPYRLARPLGYWNGLATLAAVGVVLSAGLVAGASQRHVRTAAAASLPILFVTLYFTFSRGGWVALALGLALSISLDTHRLRALGWLLALAPVSLFAVVLASRAPALAQAGEPLARAVREGHGFALALPLLAAASGFIAYTRTEPREPSTIAVERARRGRIMLVVAVWLGAAALLASYAGGGAAQPVSAGRHAPRGDERLQGRLLSTSTKSRLDYWRVASAEYEQHPILGSGAGTFELFWNRERPEPVGSRFAHSLYLQTLAELGPLALVLLAIALAAPFGALRSARRLALVPAAAGAYAAVLAHAALDWDWQLPAVMLAGLLAGAAILVSAREAATPPPRPLSRRLRAVVVCLIVVLAAFAATAWQGNRTLSLASAALLRGDNRAAVHHANTARQWQPWASEPWRQLGLAQLGLGDLVGARKSFRHAVAKDPDDWQTWYDLAIVSRGAQRATALRHARRLNPLAEELRPFAREG